jgi:hypothetical protein
MTFTNVGLEAFCFCLFLPIWRAMLVSYTPCYRSVLLYTETREGLEAWSRHRQSSRELELETPPPLTTHHFSSYRQVIFAYRKKAWQVGLFSLVYFDHSVRTGCSKRLSQTSRRTVLVFLRKHWWDSTNRPPEAPPYVCPENSGF